MKIATALFDLLRAAAEKWNADRAPRLAAALAYYATFSLAPLVLDSPDLWDGLRFKKRSGSI